MNNKHLYLAIVTGAIALSTTSIQAKESYSQNTSDTIFVCATEIETPTMFAFTPGNVKLTPIISWHQEYLLPDQSATEVCQQTATKLQEINRQQAEQKQEYYLKTELQGDRSLVCAVSEKDATCSSDDSEELFSINPNYDAPCVLDNRDPLECVALGRVRGVYSSIDTPYQPSWWPW
ncbi:COP23 domain-containing protein [Myxosarcina sp. GI1]|uniref:COP23 domain-containing protein n=1 Tax=Myxosarcina sp. GI1 TaxID=1541065 RepID=UPI00056158FE|nr:COP23 domain-containing protein [Myxosarcina sp. GI1]